MVKKDYYLFYGFVVIAVFLLTLSSFNIYSYFKNSKVLGVETENTQSEDVFWKDFLAQHPDYIPGLLETGDYQKVKQIDPNHPLQP